MKLKLYAGLAVALEDDQDLVDTADTVVMNSTMKSFVLASLNVVCIRLTHTESKNEHDCEHVQSQLMRYKLPSISKEFIPT